MLLSFRFENFRSFRDEQQMNLTRLYAVEGHDVRPAVSVAAVFGSNASGKSNFLRALSTMRDLVLFSDREVEPDMGIRRYYPYLLNVDSRILPTRYAVDIDLDGVRYTYGFVISAGRVEEEWLYSYQKTKRYPDTGRKVTHFERTGDDITLVTVGRKEELDVIKNVTAGNALYLSTVARFGRSHRQSDEIQHLHNVYGWFRGVRDRANNRFGQAVTLNVAHLGYL